MRKLMILTVLASLAMVWWLAPRTADAGPPADRGATNGRADMQSVASRVPAGDEPENRSTGFRLDLDAVGSALKRADLIRLERIPIAADRVVDLELERFSVTTSQTRFVMGQRHGRDVPLEFDADSITLLRGRVAGRPESSVFLALSKRRSYGRISLGPGDDSYQIGSTTMEPRSDSLQEFQAMPTPGGRALPAGAPLCGAFDARTPDAAILPAAKAAAVISQDRRVIDVAVETDYDLFRMAGGTPDDAMTYVVELYAAISDIYRRDANIALNITFIRLWDNPADLFNEPNPLGSFRSYWNTNMTGVTRDVAQFISGRRDLPWGGIAFLNAVCGASGYSVCGYMLGSFPASMEPGVDHYDVHVAAHELGHNFGTNHTHFYGIDTCNNFNGATWRSTIMSYCSQTRSGGNANTDLRFHADIVPFIRAHVEASLCVITDCNDNGVSDRDEINGGTSLDLNGDQVPDECQDCNGNGFRDPEEIAGGFADDLDGNGIPDQCEPDCNGNGMPDAWDISFGVSLDAFGNFIPDECEEDCDGNGTSDYTQILADMTLDLDRDTHLDACQDCNGDGVSDLQSLNGAGHVWVANDASTTISEFHPRSGARTDVSSPGLVNGGQDLIITPDGRVLVASAADDRIVEFDRHGVYVGDFVSAGSGGLNHPTSMTLGPNGNLFVCSLLTNSVLEYDGATGAFVGVFVDPPAPGVFGPHGLTFGPDGHLYVTDSGNFVVKFNGADGSFMGNFIHPLVNGGLDAPRQLLFTPNGDLVVASFNSKELLKYDGVTGAPLGRFNNGGTDAALTFDEPWGLRMGPDGLLYASRHGAVSGALDEPLPEDIAALHINSTRIYAFDPTDGDFLRSYVLGNDTALDNPTGFDFMPGDGFDCNGNLLPDSCEIAAGAVADFNGNQIPDSCECPGDMSGDGAVSIEEFLMVLSGWGICDNCPPACDGDVDSDCSVGILDFLYVLTRWGPCE